jgi:hypothetical protein
MGKGMPVTSGDRREQERIDLGPRAAEGVASAEGASGWMINQGQENENKNEKQIMENLPSTKAIRFPLMQEILLQSEVLLKSRPSAWCSA